MCGKSLRRLAFGDISSLGCSLAACASYVLQAEKARGQCRHFFSMSGCDFNTRIAPVGGFIWPLSWTYCKIVSQGNGDAGSSVLVFGAVLDAAVVAPVAFADVI